MKRIILRTFKRAAEAKGYSTGSNVYQRMNNNVLFTSEQALIDVLKTNKDVYEAAKAQATNGDTLKIAIKNECYKAFINQLDIVIGFTFGQVWSRLEFIRWVEKD